MPSYTDTYGANSKFSSLGSDTVTPPSGSDTSNGQSVGYILNESSIYWFPIRATFHRAQQVYNSINGLDFGGRIFDPYLPMLRKVVFSNQDFDNPTKSLLDVPLDPSLLFLRTSLPDFRQLIQMKIPGLTPYYNHFYTNSFGRNDFLVVPDCQMQSFRIIVESGNENILVDQSKTPRFLKGDRVLVIGGPFQGVEGVVMRFQSQKRVFVELPELGFFGTGYIPAQWMQKID